MNEIKMKLGAICNGKFVPALMRFCEMPIHSGGDSYRLMRTMNALEPELTAHQQVMDKLLRKHKAKGSLDPLREAATKLAASKHLDELQLKIRQLEPRELFSMDPSHPNWDALQADAREVNEREIELFLSQKILVRLEQVPPGALSPVDMRELNPIAEWMENGAKA